MATRLPALFRRQDFIHIAAPLFVQLFPTVPVMVAGLARRFDRLQFLQVDGVEFAFLPGVKVEVAGHFFRNRAGFFGRGQPGPAVMPDARCGKYGEQYGCEAGDPTFLVHFA